ncbi:hypothetical protein B0T16DRAFT_460226 [Cercophora newfieldiana]|uniref:Uncharacterized protein n=1 Tax=Cercophora newfieldiana TaxID=92897 RepID=A0AA39Y3D4_9PEZI|nr:hypothetical protein B0T16DRAFT_460226 [Cercophora newfieldiana]
MHVVSVVDHIARRETAFMARVLSATPPENYLILSSGCTLTTEQCVEALKLRFPESPRQAKLRHRVMEFLLTAKDDEIKIVAHDEEFRFDFHSPNGYGKSGLKPAALAAWEGCPLDLLLLSLGDSRAWTELAEIAEHHGSNARNLATLGVEDRARSWRKAIKPWTDLWKTMNERDRLNGGPGLQPLPKIDVVMYMIVW